MRRRFRLFAQLASLAWVTALVACAPPPQAQVQSGTSHQLAELWEEPTDLPQRDLFLGPGGAALTPPVSGGSYEFLGFKTAGTNPGYNVRDGSGRLWSVKLGIEAQPEVVASRVLWAMGYHQPPEHFVKEFTLNGAGGGVKTNARFRTDLAHWRSVGEWSWYDNPFITAREFRGLIVAQLVLNNWDLKTPNNRLYESTDATKQPQRVFIVRDVGSSLGSAKQFPLFTLLRSPGNQGTKNDLAGFEQQGFITSVEGDKVRFDYRGYNQSLVDSVTVADVVWASERLAGISDAQWHDAFRAGAYSGDVAERYINKIKQKVAQGMALKSTAMR